MARTCFERFSKIISITRKMAAVCGLDFMRKGFKVNFHTWFTIIAINFFLIFSFYTTYYGLVVMKDWKIMLQSLCMVGSCLQGYSKLLCGIFGRRILISLVQKLSNIYRECQVDSDYLPVLKHRIDMTTKMLKIVMLIYIATAGTIIAYPLIYGMLVGEKHMIVQFLLPGVNPKTERGYLIYVVYHASCVILGAFGNFAGDMFLFISITHIPLLKDVFRVKCLKLNRLITGEKKGSKKTMTALKAVLHWHQHYNTFVGETEAVFYSVVFVQICTSVMSICCSLFSIVTKSWPSAVFYSLYCYTMLIAYCALGNLVETSNDEIIDAIYGDILWYELSIKEQKLVLLMLRKSQNPIKLTIGHVMPLSMETALQLTKAIYSYFMMLANFLEKDDL